MSNSRKAVRFGYPQFSSVKKLPAEANNVSHRVQNTVTNHDESWFFKHPNTASDVFEAPIWSLFQLISKDYVTSDMCAHFEKTTDSSTGTEEVKYLGVNVKEISDFRPLIDDPITAADVRNKEIVKALAISLTISFFFEKNDVARHNTSKYGYQTGFHKSLFPVTGKSRSTNLLADLFYPVDPKKFCITAEDIDNLPDLRNAQPFDWPTFRPKDDYLGELSILNGRHCSLKEVQLLCDLKNDPDFIYYKFKTLLKILLISNTSYLTLASQYLASESAYKIDGSIDHIEERKKETRNVLVNMPTFQKFLMDDGQKALDEIRKELTASNKSYALQFADAPHPGEQSNDLVPLNGVDKTFNEIFTETARSCLRME